MTAHSPPPVDVCVVGSLNLDLVARVRRLPTPGETVMGSDFAEHAGGKGANQAVAAARAGARTAMIGAVGDDAAGSTLLDVVASSGVDIAGISRWAGPTGRAMIGVDDEGENSIVVIPGANGALTTHDIHAAGQCLRSARVVLMQLEVPIEVVEAVCNEVPPETIVILNPAPAAPVPAPVLKRLDVVIPNEHELVVLGGEHALFASGVTRILVTEGARGARLVTAHGTVERIEPWPVIPVDTTAAGDAFCGVFAAWLARGASWSEAAHAAAAAGALTTTRPGAIPSLPSVGELSDMIARGRVTTAR
jgi:ribokinase